MSIKKRESAKPKSTKGKPDAKKKTTPKKAGKKNESKKGTANTSEVPTDAGKPATKKKEVTNKKTSFTLDEFNWPNEIKNASSSSMMQRALALSQKHTDEECAAKVEERFPGAKVYMSTRRGDLNRGYHKFKAMTADLEKPLVAMVRVQSKKLVRSDELTEDQKAYLKKQKAPKKDAGKKEAPKKDSKKEAPKKETKKAVPKKDSKKPTVKKAPKN